MRDITGNLPPMTGIFPGYIAPAGILPTGRSWLGPDEAFRHRRFICEEKADAGITNVRETARVQDPDLASDAQFAAAYEVNCEDVSTCPPYLTIVFWRRTERTYRSANL